MEKVKEEINTKDIIERSNYCIVLDKLPEQSGIYKLTDEESVKADEALKHFKLFKVHKRKTLTEKEIENFNKFYNALDKKGIITCGYSRIELESTISSEERKDN